MVIIPFKKSHCLNSPLNVWSIDDVVTASEDVAAWVSPIGSPVVVTTEISWVAASMQLNSGLRVSPAISTNDKFPVIIEVCAPEPVHGLMLWSVVSPVLSWYQAHLNSALQLPAPTAVAK